MGLLGRGLEKRRPRDTAKYNAEGLRRVPERGSIDKALVAEDGRRRDVRDGPDATRLDRIAPESPRPAEMLEHVAVQGDDKLTVGDMKLHELLVSYAYETSNRRMDLPVYAMPTASALRFLGRGERRDGDGPKGARRRELRESLKRLGSTRISYGLKDGRRCEDVPMLAAWFEGEGSKDEIRYVVPDPINVLMSSQHQYAYLELAALAQFRSRYGVRLYRHLAFALRLHNWVPGLDNVHDVTVPVADMKAWLGWDGDHIGQLQLRALTPAIKDLAHVRKFSLVKTDPIKGKRRGGGIDGWTFTLRINEPPAHHGRMQRVEPAERSLVGGWDVPMFRVGRQDFWQRKGQFLVEHGHVGGFNAAFHTWLLAIHEALSGNAVTDGFGTRRWRGERLLAAIEADGPEDAAARLLAEEVEAPDLLAMPADLVERRERLYRIREARTARIVRCREYKAKHGIRSKADVRGQPEKTARDSAPAAPAREAPRVPTNPSPMGPLEWVEFVLVDDATERDAEVMADAIFGMDLKGEETGVAPVEGTIRYRSGPLGTDTLALGDLPLVDADVSFIAARFERIMDKPVVGRKEA